MKNPSLIVYAYLLLTFFMLFQEGRTADPYFEGGTWDIVALLGLLILIFKVWPAKKIDKTIVYTPFRKVTRDELENITYDYKQSWHVAFRQLHGDTQVKRPKDAEERDLMFGQDLQIGINKGLDEEGVIRLFTRQARKYGFEITAVHLHEGIVRGRKLYEEGDFQIDR